MKNLKLLLLSMFVMFRVSAQDYLYASREWLIDPLQNDNNIGELAVDDNGFIWASTNRGLVRFNGYQFDRFEGDLGGLGLPPGKVYSLAYHEQTLYIGTSRGLRMLDLKQYRLDSLADDPSQSLPVLAIFVDPEGNPCWFSADASLHYLRQGKVKTTSFSIQLATTHPGLILSGGYLYLADLYEGLMKIDTATMRVVRRYRIPDAVMGIELRADASGRLLCLSGVRVFHLDQKTDSLLDAREFPENVTDVLSVPGGCFIIRNGNRVEHQFEKEGSIVRQQIDMRIDGPVRLHQMYLVHGKLVATSTKGLQILEFTPKRFETLYQTYNRQTNSFDVPRGMVEDQQGYYLGAYFSLRMWDKKKRKLVGLSDSALAIHWMIKEADTLWMATEGNGLVQYVLSQRRFRKFHSWYEGKQVYLISMVQLGPDSMLLGGYNHLFLYTRSSGLVQRIPVLHEGKDLAAHSISHIIDDGISIYLATGKGVVRMDRSLQVKQLYRVDPEEGIPERNVVNAICLAPDKSVWSGTPAGLFHFSREGKLLHRLGRSTGLAGDRIASVVMDREHALWVGTYTGLSRIQTDIIRITNYYTEDGLPDNEFNRSSFLAAGNGDVLLGTVNGFIQFSPARFRDIDAKPDRLRLGKIVYGRSNGEETVFNPDHTDDRPVLLGQDIPYVKLHFSHDPVASDQRAQYFYRIVGIHPDWVSMGSTPVLHLDNIKPGRYTLYVRFVTGTGSSGILEQRLPLLVRRYFYTAPWFYGIMIALILALMFGYIRLLLVRERNLRTIRQDISQDLHDELGGYLTGITMNIELMGKNPTKFAQYQQTIRLLGKRSIMALKDGLWSLDPGSDNALQFWDRVKTVAKEILDPLNIGFTFTEPGGLRQVRLSILQKRNLLFIVKECITNAIKYGDKEEIMFEWIDADDGQKVRITNRIAVPGESNAAGNGLRNISNRMQRIGGKASFLREDGFFSVTLHL